MARKMFTQEQVRVMAENPYTLHVSTTQITFTNEFKKEFWRRYQEGDTPRTIMYDLGYDPEVLDRHYLYPMGRVISLSVCDHGCLHKAGAFLHSQSIAGG